MNPLLVVDSPRRWPLHIPGAEVVSAMAYLADPQFAQGPGRKVFNLCRSLRYQTAGYYVSLLAEARGHRPLPSVAAIQDVKLAPLIRLASQDLEALIEQSLRRIRSDAFDLSVYFGRNLAAEHDRLAKAIFNAFPAPLLRARFEREREGDHASPWRLGSVRAIGLGETPESHRPFIVEQAQRYLKRAPRRAKSAPATRFDLAILHDPQDPMPPSDAEALAHFITAGESLGLGCELIEKDAYGRIAEFDALFIRETTYVNHHTFRFARRAAAEGLVVIDDPTSILRCTNKVFLAETLARHRVPIPRTRVFPREKAEAELLAFGLPCVLKLPDSAFSAGVTRVDSPEGLRDRLDDLFANTELLIAQAYVPTAFDWRVGVLGGKALYACRYGMAADHWQIVKHGDGGVEQGDSVAVPVDQAPPAVIRLAVRAANLFGSGLYGVDLKEIDGKPIVIEVNDNPNIDHGVENEVLGDELYLTIMRHFLHQLERRRS